MEVTRPTGEATGDMCMTRDLPSLNLHMDILLVMAILATGVMDYTVAMHMEPLKDLMEGVDTDTINEAELHL